MILEKLVRNKGMLAANLLCLAVGILILFFLPGKTYKAFGLALTFQGAIYLGYKMTARKWLRKMEIIYLPLGVVTILLGLLAFIDWIHRLLKLLAFLKT